MATLIQLAAGIGALALIAGAFRYVFDPRGATAMLKTVATRLLAFVFGVAVLTRLITEFPSHAAGASQPSGWSFLLFLLLVSLIAYCVRKFRMRNVRRPADNGRTRGAERTPVLPHHMEDNE